jgi:hypothetical protein
MRRLDEGIARRVGPGRGQMIKGGVYWLSLFSVAVALTFGLHRLDLAILLALNR